MEENKTGMSPDQQAVFDRVWQRVMAGRSGPIAWSGEETHTLPQPEGETPQPTAETPESASLPVPSPDQPRGDFPSNWGVLGPGSAEAIPLLQQFIRGELEDYRAYQALARRAGGNAARTLNAMAADELRHAKELSAAYFLISGVRYWPDPGKAPAPTSYLGALRDHFAEEQEGMMAYLAAAEATQDPCLQQLFFALAQDEWHHACQIRDLIVSM
jgi:hypothetical protein